VGLQGLVFPPAQGTLATLLISTLYWFLKSAQLYKLELSKASFTSSLSRKDEKIAKSAFPQRLQVSLSAFISHYMLNAKEGICEYPLLSNYRQSVAI